MPCFATDCHLVLYISLGAIYVKGRYRRQPRFSAMIAPEGAPTAVILNAGCRSGFSRDHGGPWTMSPRLIIYAVLYSRIPILHIRVCPLERYINFALPLKNRKLFPVKWKIISY